MMLAAMILYYDTVITPGKVRMTLAFENGESPLASTWSRGAGLIELSLL